MEREAFCDAIAGDALDNAQAAFLEALVDFFPKGRRDLLRTALDRIRMAEEKAMAAGMTMLASPEMMAAVDAEIARSMDGVLSTAAPE